MKKILSCLVLFAFLAFGFDVFSAAAAGVWRGEPREHLKADIQSLVERTQPTLSQENIQLAELKKKNLKNVAPSDQKAWILFLNKYFLWIFSLVLLLIGFLFSVRHRIKDFSLFGFKISFESHSGEKKEE